MPIHPYQDQLPRLGKRVFLAPSAHLSGDVEVGDDCSFWFSTVARGDVNWIRIGARTNVQDGTVLHVTHETHPLAIGADVVDRPLLRSSTAARSRTAAWSASAPACSTARWSRRGAQVGAGAVVPPGMRVPAGQLALGVPARVVRPLSDEERAAIVDDRDALRRGQGPLSRVARPGVLSDGEALPGAEGHARPAAAGNRGLGGGRGHRPPASSRSTATARSARRSSRTPSCSRAASASRPTSSARRCTRFADKGERQPDAAAREHRRGVPRLRRARHAVAAAAGAAVLHRPAVPLRAAAEGALPPVPPDRRRADRRQAAPEADVEVLAHARPLLRASSGSRT